MFWTFAVRCYAGTESFRGLEATGTRSYLCVDKFNDIKKEQQIVDHQSKHVKRIMKQSGDETASKDQA